MAVMREMVSILSQAFLKADPPLLVSDDGTSYRPNPAAMWLRPRAAETGRGSQTSLYGECETAAKVHSRFCDFFRAPELR